MVPYGTQACYQAAGEQKAIGREDKTHVAPTGDMHKAINLNLTFSQVV